MAKPSPWPIVHAERKALAEDLATVPADAWSTPSLAAPWSVRNVLGHMTVTAAMTPPAFFANLVKSGFRFGAMIEKAIAKESTGTADQMLARFKANQDRSSGPPGPVDSWLGETIVHAEDIRRPLGIAHTYSPEGVERVARFYSGSNLVIGGKRRAAGLTLRASDAGWSIGSGPEVTGPGLSLLLAITGRPAGLADLSGDGLAALTTRMP
jgi:uncharacterized protein (TIGR03083 family)